MISAEQAANLADECKRSARENFISRHGKFMEDLDEQVKEQCSLEKHYLEVTIPVKEKFTKTDFIYLLKYLNKELKYKIRSADNGEYSFEMIWGRE